MQLCLHLQHRLNALAVCSRLHGPMGVKPSRRALRIYERTAHSLIYTKLTFRKE
jgi:hypothetical protein